MPTDHPLPGDGADEALRAAWRLACTGHSEEALSKALRLNEQAHAARDLRIEALSGVDIAWYAFQIGQAELGMRHARRALQVAQGLCDLALEAKARALHAWLMSEIGLADEAVEEAVRALTVAQRTEDRTVLALALNVVGVLFWLTRQPSRGLEYCARAVALARQNGDPLVVGWYLINLGCAHADLAYVARESGVLPEFNAAVDEAISTTEEARRLCAAAGDPWGLRLCLGNLAEYFTAAGRYNDALSALDAYAQVKGGDYDRGEEHYRYTLGQTLTHLGRVDEAIEHLLRAIELANVTGNVDALMHATRHLTDAYERKGDFRRALACHRQFHGAYVKLSAENAQKRARLADVHRQRGDVRDPTVDETGSVAASYAI
jgi:tetratricopeptide (TPR) repeat protein